jgi:hypothetical protein
VHIRKRRRRRCGFGGLRRLFREDDHNRIKFAMTVQKTRSGLPPIDGFNDADDANAAHSA